MKVISYCLSSVLFDDYMYEPTNFFGLLIGFSGGVLYTFVSYQEKMAKNANVDKINKDAGAMSEVVDEKLVIVSVDDSNKQNTDNDERGLRLR